MELLKFNPKRHQGSGGSFTQNTAHDANHEELKNLKVNPTSDDDWIMTASVTASTLLLSTVKTNGKVSDHKDEILSGLDEGLAGMLKPRINGILKQRNSEIRL